MRNPLAPKRAAVALMLAAANAASPALAATTTTTFSVQLIITAECAINSASALNFGTDGVLSADIDQTSTISVTCTNTTPYNIGLNAGTGTGATVAVRKMTNGAATVNYMLYREVGRTTIWGNTVGTDTVSATGNGAAQTHTVYGRVPVQSTPVANTYTDTITVTVTY